MNNTSTANENSSKETDDWNATGTTVKLPNFYSDDVDWLAYLTISVQWIIFFVGTLGNLMVLVVLVWRRSRSQVGTQLFVGSLAVADIGTMMSTTWLEAYDELVGNWHFGLIPCKLQGMWQWLSMNSSIWTLAALAVDRFLGINKLGGSGFKVKVAAIILACIWSSNVAFNIPMFIWADLFPDHWSGGITCYVPSVDEFVLATSLINFYLPLVITWTAYVGIIYKIKRSANKVGGQSGGAGASAGSGLSAQQQAARRVTKMCMIIATTFTVAWLPFQLNRFVMAYGNPTELGNALLALDALETIAYFNSCVNPVVYALMWRPFRLSLIQMMQSVRKCCCGSCGTKFAGNTNIVSPATNPATPN